MASVKSDTEMPMSLVSSGMNKPRLWRKPIARLSINEAPSKIGRAGLRACSLDTGSLGSQQGPAR